MMISAGDEMSDKNLMGPWGMCERVLRKLNFFSVNLWQISLNTFTDKSHLIP